MSSEPSQEPKPFRDVRTRGFQDRTVVAEGRNIIAREAGVGSTETINLEDAFDRVLVEGITSEIDIPPFARAAMDGYALQGHESFGASAYNPLEFEVVGVSLPGRPFLGTVESGQAVRIMTGAPIPEDTDSVIQFEATDELPATEGKNPRVKVTEPVAPGRNVGKVGEDIAIGTEVLPAGRRLRPQDLGVLSSLGVDSFRVVRRPTASILVTGNEILPSGSKPKEFAIVDSNSIILRASIVRDGGIIDAVKYLPDDPERIREALREVKSDIVLISGGSSVGQEDHAPSILDELGRLLFHGVALRPASPTGFGILDDPKRLVFLMPGNPVSCLCAYDIFVGEAVRSLGGRKTETSYRCRTLPLAQKISSVVGRVDYVRVRITEEGVEPIATSGASILSSTTRADGYVLIQGDSEGIPPGEEILVYLYDR